MPKKTKHKKVPFTENKYVLGIAFVILVAVLAVYVSSITGYTIIRPKASQPTLISYFGSEPQLDGVLTKADKWGEADAAVMDYERGKVWISSKHDTRYLYFLVQWEDDSPSWNDGVTFYFEDDGTAHDHSLDTKNDYFVRNELTDCTLSRTAATWDRGNYWRPVGARNAEFKCSHSKQKWTVEAKIPLTDVNQWEERFQIQQSKHELLGFAVINWETGSPGGGASKDSWNWPNDEASYGSPAGYGQAKYGFTSTNNAATWGDLNIVWTKKPAK